MGVAETYTPELRGYVRELFHDEDSILALIRDQTRAEGMPSIEVGQDEGRFLSVMAEAVGARRALEIGTLAGYSAVWIARALPSGGRLVTLEREPRHAEVARKLLERAGLADRVEVVVGDAASVLPTLAGSEPFDLVFIDADKAGYPDYLDWAIRLGRRGTAILAHNVFLGGDVVTADGSPEAERVREFNRRLADDPRLAATLVPLRDGMSLAIVR
jgi:predicted O-methyltransferase YrrM